MKVFLSVFRFTSRKIKTYHTHSSIELKQADLSFVINAKQARQTSDKIFVEKEERRLRIQQELLKKKQLNTFQDQIQKDRQQQILNLHTLFVEINTARNKGLYCIDIDEYDLTSYQIKYLKGLGYDIVHCNEWTDSGFSIKTKDLVWDEITN